MSGVTFSVSTGDGLAHTVASRWAEYVVCAAESSKVVRRFGQAEPDGPTFCGQDTLGARVVTWDEGLPTCMACVGAEILAAHREMQEEV